MEEDPGESLKTKCGNTDFIVVLPALLAEDTDNQA